MNTSSLRWRPAAVALALGALAGTSQAHTGYGTSGVYEGLVHPMGLDHLLAMVAVGLWSVTALPTHRAWWGPVTFMLSLVISALLGVAGVVVPFVEHAIALSVVLFGSMLIFTHRHVPVAVGLSAIALAAFFHGVAHGAETPASGFATYAFGFLLTTANLHFGGVFAGLAIRKYLLSRASIVLSSLGVLCGGTGVYLFSQV